MEAGEVSDKQEFVQTIKGLEGINKEKLMTLAEQFRQEGDKRTAHSIASNILKLGMNTEQVAQATGLPLYEVVELKKQLN